MRSISRIVLALIIVVGIALLSTSCIAETKHITTQAGEEIKRIVMPSAEDAQKTFKSRGTPKPVTMVNDEGGAEEPFDPSLAGNTDIVSIGINYRVALSKDRSESPIRLPWGRTPKVVITSLIPKTIDNKQKVLSMHFSMEPSRIYDLDDNRYAEFVIENPKKDFDIRIEAKIKLLRYDLSSALHAGNATPLDGASLGSYLKGEQHIEKDHPIIKEIAQQIKGEDEIDTVRKIYDFVLQNMDYDHAKAKEENLKAYGAAMAAKLKKGVCVEYSDLFVALCRAKGIPARYVGGITTEGTDATKGHAWSEVYLKNYGWVPFDATWGDTKAASFDRLRPLYIYLTDIRNDEVLNYSDIYGCEYWGVPVKVEYSALIDSSRAKYLKGLLTSINEKKTELAQMKKQIDAAYSEIESSKEELDQLQRSIKQARSDLQSASNIGPDEYRSLVSRYNSLVSAYNENASAYNKKVSAYQSIRSSYEAKSKEINALVNTYNQLN
ncbi:MAG TPA: transglutaminase domain-containing protein [Anaerolineae bacterium]|jgi:hypothetical protein|nr:transglutaminase domain-containing protein [Anaerolineae bacterium]